LRPEIAPGARPAAVFDIKSSWLLLAGVEGISQVKFTAEDVIRHELVARIVAAYEGLPQKPATGRS